MAIDWKKVKNQAAAIEQGLKVYERPKVKEETGGSFISEPQKSTSSQKGYDKLKSLSNEMADNLIHGISFTGGQLQQKSNVAGSPEDYYSLQQERSSAKQQAEKVGSELRLSAARSNLARRSGYPVNGINIEDEAQKQQKLRTQLQGLNRDIERVDYINKLNGITRDDTFTGQFRASYDIGQIGQDEAMAWKEYLSNPTAQNRLYAEAVSKAKADYALRNKEALSDDAILPWITQDLAQYLPQLKEQTIAGAKGALGGAALGTVVPGIGTALGIKGGYVAGRAAYGFDTMQGFAFKSLLDAGLDEQTAREAATDEAFISSLIEGGDAAIDLLTLGGGKVISALFKKSAQTGAKITKPMWKQILSGGAAVLGNALGEGIQEWTQEGVSIANQKRGGTGLLDLAGASVGQMWDAAFGGDTEALAQMNDAGAAGFRIGLMVGGSSRLTNAALERAINRRNGMAGSDVEDMASTFGPSGSRAFTNAVENGAPATGIYSDFVNAYNSGLHGREMPEATSDAISAGQMQAAYYAGQNDAGEKGGASRVSDRTADDSSPERQADLLEQLRQQGDTITNRQAERLMSDQAAMETLRSSAGLNLGAQDTMSKRRGAVKKAFARYARENAAQPTQETVQAEQAVAGDQVFDYAKKAEDVLKNGIFTDVYGSAFERTGISYSDLDSALTKISRNEIDTSDPVVAAVMSVLDGTEEQGVTASGVEARATKLAQNTVGGGIDASLMNSFGENGRKAFANSARNSTSPEDIYPEFSRAYVEGLTGAGQRDGMSEIAQAAYYAGQNDAEASLISEQAAAGNATIHSDARFVPNEYSAEMDMDTVNYLDTFAKATGTRIQMAAATGEGGANGWYRDGTIYIATDADKPAIEVAKHEITHRLQEIAPEEYRQYRNCAIKALAEEGSTADLVELYKARYAEAGVDLNTEQAMDEIAADFTEALVVDPDRFTRLSHDNRSVARKLLDAIKHFVSKVKSAFSDSARRNAAARDTFGVDLDTLEEAAQLWEQVLGAGAERVRNTQGSSLQTQQADATMGNTRYSIKEEQEYGRTREESREEFRQRWGRGAGSGFTIIERGPYACAYRGVARVQEPAAGVRQSLQSWGIDSAVVDGPVYVNKDGVTTVRPVREAATLHGTVFISNDTTIPPRDTAGHEAYHAWKGSDARQDYTDIVRENLDYGSREFLTYQQKIADAYFDGDVDLSDVAQLRKFEEELFAYISGHLNCGDYEPVLRAMFRDYDAVKAAWEALVRENGAARGAAALKQNRYSLKEDRNGRDDESGRRFQASRRAGHGQTLDGKGKESAGRVRRELSAASGRYGGVDPSFGTQPVRSWVAGHTVAPAEGSVVWEEQRAVMEYGVPSFVVADAAWQQNRGSASAPAFTAGGQVYFRESLPKAKQGMFAPHELTHVMRQVGYQPYLDFVERTPTMLNMSSSFARQLLDHTAKHQGTDTADADPARLYDELNATVYGHYAAGKIGDLNGPLHQVFHDFDAYIAELSELHERFRRENSGTRFSLKGTGQLQRQVQNLEERNRYLQEQLKRTKGIKTDRKKTASFARNLLTAYESQYDRDTLTGELLDIYDEIANSRDGVDMDGLRSKAREVAERVLEQSVRVDAEVYNEYSSLRNYLRTTKIKVPKSIHADLEPVGGYNGFRRGNSRRLKLSTTEGMDIDTVYRELSQQYPGLFDEQAYTNPADQIINISDVLDSIQQVVSNPYSTDMEMAARFVGNEILEGYFDVPQQRPTFADRQEARVEAARAAGNRRLTEQKDRGRQQAEKLKDRYEQRIAQLRQQGREQVQNAISRERKRRADQVKAIKEKYTSRDIATRERRNARELRNRIQRHVQALSTRLLNPTDSRNVPEALRRPVAALLAAINQESAYTLDPDTLHEVIRKDGKSGGITGKRLSRDDGRGAATKRTEAFRKLREQYLKIAGEDGDMVIDPALFGDAAEGIEGGFDTVIAMEDIPLAAMNTEQLTAVWKVVRAVEHSVSTAGKTLSETKYEATKDWALALERDTASRKNRRTLTENGVLKSLENPYTFFSHYGEAGHAVYRMLRNAQDRQQLMQKQVEQEARNIADPKTVKRLEKTVHTFTTERGDRLTLSTAQVMELYELMKREQAHNHLLKGGIVQPAIRSKKIRRGTDAILLSGEDLGSIVKVLSDEEITIADGLQKLTAGLLADYGNEASMAVYGYKKFTGTDYWPIQTAKEGIHATVEKGANNTRSIKNIGLAKATVPHASNALDLPGIFETFAAHSADMVDYAAWLAPMEDANRLFNYKYRDENGNPTNRTVKGLLERVGGSGAQKYWSNLMENIQNGIAVPGDDPMTRLVSKGIGSFKGAAVGGNVRVVIQQPTAFFRAGVVLSPADLTKGLVKGVTSGSGWQKALQYSPIAIRKNDGSFDISNPATMKETLFDGRSRVRKFNDALSAPAGMADAITWGRLWNACEWATAREHKGLRAGSEAFYRKVNELFTEVIDQTQVVDGVLQRSNIMRSRNTLAQQATSFMGEPIMSLNIFLRAYDQMRYEQDAGKRGKAKKRLGRAVTALLVTNVVNALAQSLVDAMRDDDEDKKYWERFRSAFTGLTGEEESAWDKAVAVVLNGNAGSALNVAGQIPYVRDVLSLAQGYDVARTDMEIFSDLVRAAQTLMQSAGGNGPRTRAYAVKELISAGAKVFGTPVGNLARDIFGFARSVAVQTDNIPLQFEMEKAVYNITNEKNKGRYYDILFRALRQNDMDSYFRMQRELMNEMGVDGEQIAGAMRERLKKAGEEDPGLQLSQEVYDLLGLYEQHAPPKPSPERFGPDDLEADTYRAYSQQSAADFRALHDRLKTMDAFAALPDEEKDNALDAARTLAENIALRDHSGGQYTEADFSLWERWAEMGEGYGVDETEAILFRIAYDMTEGDPDEKGDTVSGSKKENVLEAVDELMPWLTDAELEYLKTLYWNPEDRALKSLKENKFMPG